MNAQYIETPVEDEMAILPRSEHDLFIDALADASDVAAVDKFKERLAAGDEELVPSHVVDRLLAGENKVRVWREHRGMTARDLAAATNVSAGYLAQIETSVWNGAVDDIQRIAIALRVPFDELV